MFHVKHHFAGSAFPLLLTGSLLAVPWMSTGKPQSKPFFSEFPLILPSSSLTLAYRREALVADTVNRLHAIFHGEVQGVGFRYSTRRCASAYPQVTGVVRNLPDGTVELIAEGDKSDIDSLCSDIHSLLGSYISRTDSQWSQALRRYSVFGTG
jgi:acylphosphatase